MRCFLIGKPIYFKLVYEALNWVGECWMPWKILVCLFIVVLGLFMFLYGANYYDAMIGWTGVGLFIGGVVLYVVLKLLESLHKKQS